LRRARRRSGAADHARGYDWTKRYPWIAESALKNRIKQFVLDGEAVVLGVDGISDFNALHSGRHNKEVQLCAFDVLARAATICAGFRSQCARPILPGSSPADRRGSSSTPLSGGEIGPDLFRKTCELGVEGLNSTSGPRSGKSRLIKAKNREHNAFESGATHHGIEVNDGSRTRCIVKASIVVERP
jgi:ATP-dependent DNA ligase